MIVFKLWFGLFLSILFARAHSFDSGNAPGSANASYSIPMIRSFETREQLLDSAFWDHFIYRKNPLTVRNTVIFIKDEKRIIIFNEEDQEKKSLLWIPWVTRYLARLKFTEIDLGHEVYWVGSNNYPILTASAEYSSNILLIEHEVVRGNSVRVNPSLLTLLAWLQIGLRIVIESTNSLYMAERESIICRASPGGRVQLQVSSTMLSFPAAKSRSLEFDIRSQEFTTEKWSYISSSVEKEVYDGLLMLLSSSFVLARCVTNETMFEMDKRRKIVEYRSVFNDTYTFRAVTEEPDPLVFLR